jgi:hypothetical protein
VFVCYATFTTSFSRTFRSDFGYEGFKNDGVHELHIGGYEATVHAALYLSVEWITAFNKTAYITPEGGSPANGFGTLPVPVFVFGTGKSFISSIQVVRHSDTEDFSTDDITCTVKLFDGVSWGGVSSANVVGATLGVSTNMSALTLSTDPDLRIIDTNGGTGFQRLIAEFGGSTAPNGETYGVAVQVQGFKVEGVRPSPQ